MIPVEFIDEVLYSKWFDSPYAHTANAITSISDIQTKFSYSIPDWSEIFRLVDISSCVYVPALSGYRFCDLPELKKLTSDDLFLISKLNSAYLNEMNQRIEGPRSLKLTYDVLSTQMADDLDGRIHVGTMAYRDWWEYSEVEHNHDLIYNSVVSVECVNDYLTADNTVSVMGGISVGLSTEGLTPILEPPFELCCPADQYIPVVEPAIGSLMFCSSNKVVYKGKPYTRDIENWPYSAEFDGWVPANGKKIQLNNAKPYSGETDFAKRFAKALNVFGSNDLTEFTVPTVEGFYKWTDDFHSDEPFGNPYAAHTSLINHTHKLTPVINSNINDMLSAGMDDFISRIKARDKFATEDVHAGKKVSDTSDPSYIAERGLPTNLLDLRSRMLCDIDHPQISLPVYPDSAAADPVLEHDVIPTMVYIGGHMQNYILYEKYHNYTHRRDLNNKFDA